MPPRGAERGVRHAVPLGDERAMFGLRDRRDVRSQVHAAHRRHQRRAVLDGLDEIGAHHQALHEVVAERLRLSRGVLVTASSREVRAEVIPFLRLAPAKSVEVLAEYFGWLEQGREDRLGYVRAMLAIAFKEKERWSRGAIRALAHGDLARVGWLSLLSKPLRADLRQAQTDLRRRSLQYLQDEAALAV
jgi:hypothetical protein